MIHDREYTFVFDYLDEQTSVTAISDIFDGSNTFESPLTSRGQWLIEVRNRLQRAAVDHLFEDLRRHSSGRTEFLDHVRMLLGLDETYDDRLSELSTLFAIRIATFYILLEVALQNREHAVQFLVSRHPELNQMTPLEAAMTTDVRNRVIEIIARGLHGLPA